MYTYVYIHICIYIYVHINIYICITSVAHYCSSTNPPHIYRCTANAVCLSLPRAHALSTSLALRMLHFLDLLLSHRETKGAPTRARNSTYTYSYVCTYIYIHVYIYVYIHMYI